MAVYSTNQNRQLYVAKAWKDEIVTGKDNNVSTKLTTIGDMGINAFGDAQPANCSFYFVQKSYDGIIRSDIIPVKSIMWVTKTTADKMAKKLKQVTVKLDTNVNGGQPISGQDYVLRINFRQYYGMSDEDIYQKYGAVHAYAGMTDVQFYTEMAYSLFKNFSRLYSPSLDIEVGGKVVAKASKVNGTITLYDDTGTAITVTNAGIKINEKSQTPEWALGTKQLTKVQFDVIPTTVRYADNNNVWGTTDVIWGTVEEDWDTLTPINNSFDIADLEYFCMGERGDQYRNVGWPKSIPTKYMVTAADDSDGYDVLDIHYAYKGTCEDIQNSEKTLTIVAPAGSIDDIADALPDAVKALIPEDSESQEDNP